MEENQTSLPGSTQKAMRFVVFLLFFGSGVSGLVYEVVWTRHLIYLFGATLFAVSTVLAAFMGGLALGSYILGKYADKNRNNLRLYAILEVGIAVSALLLPFLLSLLDPIYRVAYTSLKGSFFLLSLLRFILTFAVLLIPTTMMGGTLPVLSRFLARKKETLGLNVGALYSLNTLGAVLGCFLTGFIFIAAFGVRGATFLAAGVNLLVALVAFLLARARDEAPESLPEKGEKPASPDDDKKRESDRKIIYAVLWCYAISGFIALSYQVTWNRALVFTFEIMKNTTYSFTAMLTVFLVGLALGGAVMSAFIDRQKDTLRLFALIQLLIGICGAFSFFAIFHLGPGISPFTPYDEAGNILWWHGVLNVFSKTGAAVFLPTFLMGMAFPVATKICVDRISSVGFGVGRLYSVNTLGSIIGSFASGFILIPALGVAGTIFVLATGNLLIALYLFRINPQLAGNSRKMLTVLCGIAILILLIRMPREVRFQELAPTERSLFYKEGPLATVSVIENSFKYRTIYVDNVGVAGTDRILLTDQKSLAHIPMLLLTDPKSALTVGFGSGGASYSYTLYDSIDDIHCVEICKTVMDAAPDLLASNHGILLPVSRNVPMPIPLEKYSHAAMPGYLSFDQRYRIIFDDVRSYLRFTGRKYDIIATDCTDLRYKSNANLYDYEYFRLCRKHLSEDGMVVVWMPLAGLSDDMFRLALRTFYRVFPEMSIWYMNNESTHYILLIGTPRPLKIDYALLRERLGFPKVKEDLAELFLDDADKLLSCFLCDQHTLEAFLEGDKINTENRPFLEFESPKYGYGDQPMIDNLESLMSIRTSILPYIENVKDRPAFEARMKKYSDALPHIIRGHSHYRRLEMVEACREYMKAVSLCPEDRATKYLLDFDEIQLRIAAHPFEPWAYRQLGAVYFEQKRFSEAVTVLNQLLENCPVPPANAPEETVKFHMDCLFAANKMIGQSYIEVGNEEYAIRYLKRAKELNPNDQETADLLKSR